MLAFGSLWLQVLLVAVATFALSAIFWMVMPWHKSEFKELPDEEAVRQVMLAGGVGPGQYRVPFCRSMEEAKSDAFTQKLVAGPVGIIQLQKPRDMPMGLMMFQQFALFAVIAFFTAYVLRSTQVAGAAQMSVFRVAFCVSFAAHAFGNVQDAIWFSKSWERVWKQALDSAFYAAATGGIFAGMWPGAE